MSFDWPHYLHVAQGLTEEAKDAPPDLQEAKYRAAISRAYYAVFGRARHHLRHIDKIAEPPNIGTHYHVRDTFRNSQDQNRRNIGAIMDRMRKDRNAADYYLQHDRLRNLSDCAKRNLREAKDAFKRLDRIQKK